jgi:hypothetical protein
MPSDGRRLSRRASAYAGRLRPPALPLVGGKTDGSLLFLSDFCPFFQILAGNRSGCRGLDVTNVLEGLVIKKKQQERRKAGRGRHGGICCRALVMRSKDTV